MKIRLQSEWISKIPSCGWRSWKNWFFTFSTFLAPAIFLIHDVWKNDQKVTGTKKVLILKNLSFHAYWSCKGIFEISSYYGLLFLTVLWNFEFLFQIGEIFFQKNFWLKSLQIVSSLTGLMCSENNEPWRDSTVYKIIYDIYIFLSNSTN